MQRPGNEFFAGARFAGDQHGGIRLRQPADRPKHFLHRRRLTENFRLFGSDDAVRRNGVRFRGRAADQRQRMIDIEGLRKVFERAALERCDSAVEIGVGRHDDHRHLRITLLDLIEKHEPRLARHADVGDEHLRLADRQRLQHFVCR